MLLKCYGVQDILRLSLKLRIKNHLKQYKNGYHRNYEDFQGSLAKV